MKLNFAAHFLKQGYTYVVQHERGRYWSEGEFSIISNGGEDGYDSVDWIANQPWSNGKVGTIGCSSSGDSQIPQAIADHPAHAAAITMASGSSLGVVEPFHDQGLFYFPRFTRNLNTGGNNFDETEGRTALNSVHISEQHPSRMVLPILHEGGNY